MVIACDTNKLRLAEALAAAAYAAEGMPPNDRSAYNLAEFAVGLNPASRAYTTNLEDLGKLCFGHHGIGSNYAIGGSVAAPCHIDIIYADASLYVDGKLILDKGEVLI